MNCERCQTELEDFLYGELTERRAAEVRSHLADCAACAAVRARLDQENEIFAQFYEETALEPGAEMWTAIRARIADEPRPAAISEPHRPRWFDWLLIPAVLRQAAFAAILIAVTAGVTALLLRRDEGRGSGSQPSVAGSQSPVAGSQSPVAGSQSSVASSQLPVAGSQSSVAGSQLPVAANRQLATANRPPATANRLTEEEQITQQIARAEREYQGAIRLLDRAIAKRREGFDAEVFRQYEASLALIDDSIAQSRRALRAKPDDVTAGQFLLAAYAKKIELMQDIAMR